MKSFSCFSQPAEVWTPRGASFFHYFNPVAVKPIVAKTFPLADAADALRYLVEGRPFGRVIYNLTAFARAGWIQMNKYKIAVLDDYQNVALESADWSVLRDRADIAVFQNHLADPDALIERCLPFDVGLCHARGDPAARNVIGASQSKLIASTDLETRRSMSPPRAIMGSHWFTRDIGRTPRSNLPGR